MGGMSGGKRAGAGRKKKAGAERTIREERKHRDACSARSRQRWEQERLLLTQLARIGKTERRKTERQEAAAAAAVTAAAVEAAAAAGKAAEVAAAKDAAAKDAAAKKALMRKAGTITTFFKPCTAQ